MRKSWDNEQEPASCTAREADEYLSRIAAPMRGDEWLDDTFEERVMAAVHAMGATPAGRPAASFSMTHPWWRRVQTVRVTPVGGFAAAAGFAAIMMLGGAVLRDVVTREDTPRVVTRDVRTREVIRDTVHLLRFVLVDARARRVSVVGDFNGWDKSATPLKSMALSGQPGVWAASVALPPGRYEYAFIVHGDANERWVLDPSAEVTRDDLSVESSVVTVGRRTADHTSRDSARRRPARAS